MNPQQQSFMTTVRSVNPNTKINYDKIRTFFVALVTHSIPLSNPLRVKGDTQKIASVYATAICEYIFNLSRIYCEENTNMFDSHSNIGIRKTYIKQIAEFIKLFPSESLEGFNVA